MPFETASGGIKAPQYFAPGVAGDHGEPSASATKPTSEFALNDVWRLSTSNDLTLSFPAPFAAVSVNPAPWARFNFGWRRDQTNFQNTDRLTPLNSFQKWTGVNSPKATVTMLAPDRIPLPSVSFSFGQASFSYDPRIGLGTAQGARSF